MKTIDEWVKKLKNKVLIVEGIKDKKALSKIGVKRIFILNKPIFKIVEDVSKITKEVVILTDLDKKGKQLYSKLKKGFERHRVKVDDRFRRFLFKERIIYIEGIKLR